MVKTYALFGGKYCALNLIHVKKVTFCNSVWRGCSIQRSWSFSISSLFSSYLFSSSSFMMFRGPPSHPSSPAGIFRTVCSQTWLPPPPPSNCFCFFSFQPWYAVSSHFKPHPANYIHVHYFQAIYSHFKSFQVISSNSSHFQWFLVISSHFQPFPAMLIHVKQFPAISSNFQAFYHFQQFSTISNPFQLCKETSSSFRSFPANNFQLFPAI